jgi:hypothetical protein
VYPEAERKSRQDGAPILLILDDKNALTHAAPAATAARTGSSM